MSFRTRLTLAAAIAVAVAIAVASAVSYAVVRNQLRGSVDASLQTRVSTRFLRFHVDPVSGKPVIDMPPPLLGAAPGYTQLVSKQGQTILQENEPVPLPVTDRVKAAAAGTSAPFFFDAQVQGTHVRILTVPLGAGFALEISRPLAEVDHALGRIRLYLLMISLGGIAIAAALGLAVASTALLPVRRLTEATEHVAETQDLTSRIASGGRDELGRLASSFNTMLDSLERSVRSQRQLVADASHELRTPLTSLRTNIEVLARSDRLPADERERLLEDVVEQLAEMSTLVSELVELARGDQRLGDPEEIRLDLLVEDAVGRARRNSPAVTFLTRLEPTTIEGIRSTIERAVANLLDNAAKWSPAGGPVEVRVSGGQVVVRDHGPGIDDTDLPHIFDRFYRSSSARGLPGSGLGLAIVRQVAEAHGGVVEAEHADGGGTLMRLRLAPGTG
jgi:two-component system sensor histidine kinase MprB